MLWEHELQASVSTAFSSFQNFHERFCNSLEKLRTCFLILLENNATRNGKQHVNFDYQNVNSLCLCHRYVNSSCWFCVSIKLQKPTFDQIFLRTVF